MYTKYGSFGFDRMLHTRIPPLVAGAAAGVAVGTACSREPSAQLRVIRVRLLRAGD